MTVGAHAFPVVRKAGRRSRLSLIRRRRFAQPRQARMKGRLEPQKRRRALVGFQFHYLGIVEAAWAIEIRLHSASRPRIPRPGAAENGPAWLRAALIYPIDAVVSVCWEVSCN